MSAEISRRGHAISEVGMRVVCVCVRVGGRDVCRWKTNGMSTQVQVVVVSQQAHRKRNDVDLFHLVGKNLAPHLLWSEGVPCAAPSWAALRALALGVEALGGGTASWFRVEAAPAEVSSGADFGGMALST